MEDYSNLSHEERVARLADIDRQLAELDVQTQQDAQMPTADYAVQKPIEEMSADERKARIAQIDSELARMDRDEMAQRKPVYDGRNVGNAGAPMRPEDFAGDDAMGGVEKVALEAQASGAPVAEVADGSVSSWLKNLWAGVSHNTSGRVAEKNVEMNLQDILRGTVRKNGKDVPLTELPDSELDHLVDAAGWNGAGAWFRRFLGPWARSDEGVMQEWDRTDGARIADPVARKAARVRFAQERARDITLQNEREKQAARAELQGREKQAQAGLVGGLVQTGSYMIPFALPGAHGVMAGLIGGAERGQEMASDRYEMDADGNVRVAAQRDSTGAAVAKGVARGIVEPAIELVGGTLATKALGGLGSATLGRIPLVKSVGGKLAETAVGKVLSRYGKNMQRFGKATGLQGMPEETIEELEDNIFDAVLGIDRRESEKEGGALRRGAEAAKEFFKPESLKNLAESMLLIQILGGSMAYVSDRIRSKPIDNLLAEGAGIDKDVLKDYTADEKWAAFDAYVNGLTEEQVREKLGKGADAINDLVDTIAKGKREVDDFRDAALAMFDEGGASQENPSAEEQMRAAGENRAADFMSADEVDAQRRAEEAQNATEAATEAPGTRGAEETGEETPEAADVPEGENGANAEEAAEVAAETEPLAPVQSESETETPRAETPTETPTAAPQEESPSATPPNATDGAESEKAAADQPKVAKRSNRLRRGNRQQSTQPTQETANETGNGTAEASAQPEQGAERPEAVEEPRQEQGEAQGAEAQTAGVVEAPKAATAAPALAEGYTTKPGAGKSVRVYGPDGEFVGSILGDGTRYVDKRRLEADEVAPWEARPEAETAPATEPAATEQAAEPPKPNNRLRPATTAQAQTSIPNSEKSGGGQDTTAPDATQPATQPTAAQSAQSSQRATQPQRAASQSPAQPQTQAATQQPSQPTQQTTQAVATQSAAKPGRGRPKKDFVASGTESVRKIMDTARREDGSYDSDKFRYHNANGGLRLPDLKPLYESPDWHTKLGLDEKSAENLRDAVREAYEDAFIGAPNSKGHGAKRKGGYGGLLRHMANLKQKPDDTSQQALTYTAFADAMNKAIEQEDIAGAAILENRMMRLNVDFEAQPHEVQAKVAKAIRRLRNRLTPEERKNMIHFGERERVMEDAAEDEVGEGLTGEGGDEEIDLSHSRANERYDVGVDDGVLDNMSETQREAAEEAARKTAAKNARDAKALRGNTGTGGGRAGNRVLQVQSVDGDDVYVSLLDSTGRDRGLPPQKMSRAQWEMLAKAGKNLNNADPANPQEGDNIMMSRSAQDLPAERAAKFAADADYQKWLRRRKAKDAEPLRQRYELKVATWLASVAKRMLPGLKVSVKDRAFDPARDGGEGARQLSDGGGRVLGTFNRATGELTLFRGANWKTLDHELGGHATLRFAEQEAARGNRALLDRINGIIDSAPQALVDDVKSRYPDADEATLRDEIWAAIREGRESPVLKDFVKTLQGRQWYNRAWDAIKAAWKGLLARMGLNRADLSGIDRMTPDEFNDFLDRTMAEGRTLGRLATEDATGGGRLRRAFAGRVGAKRLGIGKHRVAERMEKDGASREEIWERTGWWRGKDGKWRIEIPDAGFAEEFKGDIERARDGDAFDLGSVVDAPELFKAYPELEDTVLMVRKFGDGTRGEYDPGRGIISIGEDLPMDEKRSTLVHELQHAAQKIEGFARGSNPEETKEMLEDRVFDRYREERESLEEEGDRIYKGADGRKYIDWLRNVWAKRYDVGTEERLNRRLRQEAFEREVLTDEERSRLDYIRERLAQIMSAQSLALEEITPESSYQTYRKVAGEVESRNAQTRRNYGELERGVIPPWATEDVPEPEQIVLGGEGGASASALAPETGALDADYMDAVERGDTEAAQRMVFARAREVYGDSLVTDSSGNPVVFYHGSKQRHNVFDPRKDKNGFGDVYFTDTPEYARKFGDEVQAVILVADNPSQHDFSKEGFRNAITSRYSGHDSAFVYGVMDFTGIRHGEVLMRKMENIKSADPVTRDDAGNVIPLSQRFNRRNDDIRYSRAPAPAGSNIMDDVRTGTEKARERFLDSHAPIKDVQDEIPGVKEEIRASDGYTDWTKSTDVAAALQKANGRVEHETRRLQRKVDMMARALNGARLDGQSSEELLQDLDLYAQCKHAKERNDTIARRNGVTPDDDYSYGMGEIVRNGARVGLSANVANDIIAELEAKYGRAKFRHMKNAQRALVDINRDDIRRRLESGKLSPSEANYYLYQWSNYVPLKTDVEQLEPGLLNSSTAGPKRSEFMKAFGRGTADIADSPVAASLLQAEQGIRGSIRNETANVLANLVEWAEAQGLHIGEIVEGIDEAHHGSDYVFTFSDADRVKANAGMQMADKRDDIQLFKRDGKLYAVRVDKGVNGRGLDFMRSFKGDNVESWGDGILSKIPAVTHWMSAMRTQYSPEFSVSNYLADSLEAAQALMGRYGVWDGAAAFAKAVAAEIRNAKDVWRYVRRGELRGDVKKAIEAGLLTKGGVASAGFEGKEQDVRLRLDKLRRSAERFWDLSAGDKAKWAWESGKDFIAAANEFMEYSTRIGLFSALHNKGVPVNEAVKFAREATVDFNRKGSFMPIVNGLYMFANASVQGAARAVQAGRESVQNLPDDGSGWGRHKVRGDFIALLVGIGAAKAVIDHFGGNDDDRERKGGRNARNMSEYDKKHNVGIPVGGGRQMPLLRFRGPYAALPYLAQTATNVILGETKPEDALAALPRELSDQITDLVGGNGMINDKGELDWNLLGQSVAPSAIDPIIQLASGKDYKGDERVKRSFDENTPKSWNGKRNTPWPYQKLTQAVNALSGGNSLRKGKIDIAPEDAQLVWEFIWGGFGRDVGNLYSTAQNAYHAAKGGDTDRLLTDMPVVRRLVREYPESTSRYFDALDSYEKDKAEFKGTKDAGRRRELKRARPYLSAEKGRVDRLVERIKELTHLERGEIKRGKSWVEPKMPIGEKQRDRHRKERLRLQAQVLRILGG